MYLYIQYPLYNKFTLYILSISIWQFHRNNCDNGGNILRDDIILSLLYNLLYYPSSRQFYCNNGADEYKAAVAVSRRYVYRARSKVRARNSRLYSLSFSHMHVEKRARTRVQF